MRILGAILIIVGLLTTLMPSYYTCAAEGKAIQLPGGKTVPMKCLWTARAEIGAGSMVMLVGVLLFVSRNLESRKLLSLCALSLGILIFLFPTTLIGVCANPEMPCASVMKPILLLTGSIAAALGMIGLIWSLTKTESRA